MDRRELRAALKQRLSLLLSQQSFAAKGFVWNRRGPGFIDVIDVQWGKTDTQEDYSFTLNAGVCWPKAYEACWLQPLPPLVQSVDCTKSGQECSSPAVMCGGRPGSNRTRR
jgi:hypothetical protein